MRAICYASCLTCYLIMGYALAYFYFTLPFLEWMIVALLFGLEELCCASLREFLPTRLDDDDLLDIIEADPREIARWNRDSEFDG